MRLYSGMTGILDICHPYRHPIAKSLSRQYYTNISVPIGGPISLKDPELSEGAVQRAGRFDQVSPSSRYPPVLRTPQSLRYPVELWCPQNLRCPQVRSSNRDQSCLTTSGTRYTSSFVPALILTRKGVVSIKNRFLILLIQYSVSLNPSG